MEQEKYHYCFYMIIYEKAYDSVSHTWLLKILELYMIDMTLRSFLEACMGQWVITIRVLYDFV